MAPKPRKRLKEKATAKGDANNSQNGKKAAKSDADKSNESSGVTKVIVLLVVATVVCVGVAIQLGYIDIKQLQEFNGSSKQEEPKKPIVKETEKQDEVRGDRVPRNTPEKSEENKAKKKDEPNVEKQKIKEPIKEKAPETKKEKVTDKKKEKAPEAKKDKTPESKKEKAQEQKKENAQESKKEKVPEPKREKVPEPKKEKVPEPKKEKAPELKKEKAPELKKDKAPEPKKDKAPEPKKDKAPEPKKEKATETKKEKAPVSETKEKVPEPKKEKTKEVKEPVKKAPEPQKEKVPETKKEKAKEPKKEKAPESKKEKVPEPRKEKMPETKKENVPETKEEKVQELKKEKIQEKKEKPPEPEIDEELPQPKNDKQRKIPQPVKEKVQEPKKETPEPKNEKPPKTTKEKASDKEQKSKDKDAVKNEIPDVKDKKQKKKNKEEVIVDGRTNSYDKAILTELETAEELLTQKKSESALRRFEKLLTSHPASPRARLGRANALHAIAEEQRSNDLLKACISAYEEASKAPNCPQPILKEAIIAQAERLRFSGNSAKAVTVLESLNQKIPNDVTVLRELGVAYLIKGNNQASKPIFKKILEIIPGDGHAKVHLGFILKSETKYEESIPLLTEGIATGEEGTNEGKYYFHLGDALYRLGRVDEAYNIYNTAAEKGHFLSKWQRSLYNVESLTAKPWWTPESAKVAKFVKLLEDNWQAIRDEGVANMDPKTGAFVPEVENLRETGDWKQFTLYRQGKRNDENCKRAPKTCAVIDKIPMATSNKRGQVKFSVLHPGTHIWAHCGPTNCRLRGHLGLVVPDGLKIRVKNDTRTWQEGKMLIFDDSFEHEVWHEGNSYRLILIVDFWHPELTETQKRKLTAI